jgi:hypothetical protein
MSKFEYKKFKPSEQTNELLNKKTAAEDALAGLGSYSWAGQGAYNKLLEDYKNRGDFSYDVNADALYNQYKDKHIQQGKMAMADAIGQASAMTGGYGNSYAATVGNQAYQAQMQNLNDIVPTLYSMAYERFNQKGQDMLNTLGLMENERSVDYSLWADKYDRLAADRDYHAKQYDTAWERDYGDHQRAEDYRAKTYDGSLNSILGNMTGSVTPAETKRTRDFVDKMLTKDESGYTEDEWLKYIEDQIASYASEYDLDDSELLWLIQHYEIPQ